MTKLTSASKEIELDRYCRRVLHERDVCDMLYRNPEIDLTTVEISDPSQHNQAVGKNFSDLSLIAQLEEISVDPETWHHNNQKNWLMPDEYKQLNLIEYFKAKLLEELQETSEEKLYKSPEWQRFAEEYAVFNERNVLDLLKYIIYLVDTMNKHDVVWGVGRGSSVASYVLYLTGIHSVNSIQHNLDFYEFMR